MFKQINKRENYAVDQHGRVKNLQTLSVIEPETLLIMGKPYKYIEENDPSQEKRVRHFINILVAHLHGTSKTGPVKTLNPGGPDPTIIQALDGDTLNCRAKNIRVLSAKEHAKLVKQFKSSRNKNTVSGDDSSETPESGQTEDGSPEEASTAEENPGQETTGPETGEKVDGEPADQDNAETGGAESNTPDDAADTAAGKSQEASETPVTGPDKSSESEQKETSQTGSAKPDAKSKKPGGKTAGKKK